MNIYKTFVVRSGRVDVLDVNGKKYITARDINMLIARSERGSISALARGQTLAKFLSLDDVELLQKTSKIVKVGPEYVKAFPCREAISFVMAIIKAGSSVTCVSQSNCDLKFMAEKGEEAMFQLAKQGFISEFCPEKASCLENS